MERFATSLNTLRRTLVIAEAMARKSAPLSIPSSSTSTTLLSVSDLNLPTPEPLTPRLLALGVDAKSAECISDAMMQAVSRLNTVCETDFQRRHHSLQNPALYSQIAPSLSRPPTPYAAIVSRAIRHWSSYVLDNFAPRFLKAQRVHQESSHPAVPHHKRPFNQDAVPLLEQFFASNAFPTRLEKYELASKCHMDYRQIYVWFQNRRSRFRKEGRELRKPSRAGSISDELENAVLQTLLPVTSTLEGSVEAEEHLSFPSSNSRMSNPLFDLTPPPHAYPTPYPPSCHNEPFPDTPHKRAFQMPWIRAIWAAGRKDDPQTSVDALADAFAKLSITSGSSKHCPMASPYRRSSDVCSSYTLGFITPCAKAPLSALVRPPKWPMRSPCHPPAHSLSTTTRLFQSQASVDSGNAADHYPSLKSKPAPSPSVRARVKRTLPRRLPKNPPACRQHPALSSVSTKGRTSSFSSSSSHACSESDDTESPLSTPPLQLSPLPIVAFSGLTGDCSFSDFSFDSLISADSVRWRETLDTSLYALSPKPLPDRIDPLLSFNATLDT